MSPVANMVVFGIVGLVALPVLRRLSRTMAVRIAFIVMASMFFVSILVLKSARFGQIHFAARVILSIGLSVALQRLLARRALGFERFVRRTTIIMVLLVLGLTLAVGGRQYVREQRIISTLPDSPPSAPNVLLVVWDTVRSKNMSLYGYERMTTPFLCDIAKEGTVFEQAIATSSYTLPTHVSLFTGRYHYEALTGWFRPLDATYPTLAEALTSHGYVTGGFVANTIFCVIEFGLARGFSHYEDWIASVGEFARSSALVRFTFDQAWIRRLFGYYEQLGRKPARRITNDFLSWVDRIPSDRPFFAFLNYFDAHQPYLPPAEFARRFGCTDELNPYLVRYCYAKETCLPSNTTVEEIRSMRNAYDAAIAYLDADLNRLFDELKRRDLLDRTLVILVSDHGEEFGEHDVLGHGIDLHIPLIRVPLLLRLPGIVPDGVSVQEPVTLRDIPSTVISLLGLQDNGLFPGQSLERYWNDSRRTETERFEPVLSELSQDTSCVGTPVAKGDMKSLIVGDIHYIRNGDGAEEIYDICYDPAEHNNLIKTPRGAEAVEQARCILKEMTR
jgi:arylsulfatase A-like enzyme